MTDTSKIEELLERLDRGAAQTSRAYQAAMEAKSLRQEGNHERRKDLYFWPKPEETVEGKAATTIRALLEREAKLREEIEERDEWLQIVDTTPLDEFDKLGDYWVQRICVTNMTQALASVFVKFAPERIMSGFREGMRNIIHQAFVEGCIAGVRAERGQALQETDNAG